MFCVLVDVICTSNVLDMHLRSVDLTNFIYITDESMEYIGRITTYVRLLGLISRVTKHLQLSLINY